MTVLQIYLRAKWTFKSRLNVTFSVVFINNLRDAIEAMEERTTTMVRIIPAIKKDPLRSLFKTWAGVDSNHRTLAGTDLQSVAFSHSATYPYLIFICDFLKVSHLFFRKLPLTRFELVASPLPRECATPAPQRLKCHKG